MTAEPPESSHPDRSQGLPQSREELKQGRIGGVGATDNSSSIEISRYGRTNDATGSDDDPQALRFEGTVPPGPYRQPPSPNELERVRRKIRETGQPELVETISWTKPAKTGEHRLIYPPITVDKKLRPGGEMVPCPLCSPNSPKCYTFYLLWSEDGCLRVIGHVCGLNHFGDAAFKGMEKAARRVLAEKANEDFLLNNLPCVPYWFADARTLRPICEKIQKIRRRFMSGVSSLHEELWKMARNHDGGLVVERKKERIHEGPSGFRSSLGGHEAEHEFVTIAHLQGIVFLNRSFNPVSELGKIEKALEALVGDYEDGLSDDDVLEFVCEAVDNGTLRPVEIEDSNSSLFMIQASDGTIRTD